MNNTAFAVYSPMHSRSLLLNQIPVLPSNSAPTKKIERLPHGDPEGQTQNEGESIDWWVLERRTCDVPTNLDPSGGLTSTFKRFTVRGEREEEKERKNYATLGHTLADHVKS